MDRKGPFRGYLTHVTLEEFIQSLKDRDTESYNPGILSLNNNRLRNLQVLSPYTAITRAITELGKQEELWTFRIA